MVIVASRSCEVSIRYAVRLFSKATNHTTYKHSWQQMSALSFLFNKNISRNRNFSEGFSTSSAASVFHIFKHFPVFPQLSSKTVSLLKTSEREGEMHIMQDGRSFLASVYLQRREGNNSQVASFSLVPSPPLQRECPYNYHSAHPSGGEQRCLLHAVLFQETLSVIWIRNLLLAGCLALEK